MKKSYRLTGRFLPSRVYYRWKWFVRTGLFVVPLLALLTGGIRSYLAPNQYLSETEFEYRGDRPLAQVEGLLRSRNVMSRAFLHADLSKKAELDFDSLYEMVSGGLKIGVDPDSRLIALEVEFSQKELSRDIAEALVWGLRDYEKSLYERDMRKVAHNRQIRIWQAEEIADEKRKTLGDLVAARKEMRDDPVSQVDIAEARLGWETAFTRLAEDQEGLRKAEFDLSHPPELIQEHTNATLADQPVEKDFSLTFGGIVLLAVAYGMGFALCVPYFLELVFPRSLRVKAEPSEEGWREAGAMVPSEGIGV